MAARLSSPQCKRLVDSAAYAASLLEVIRSFKSKALADLWSAGKSSRVDPRLQNRILVRLDRLNVAVRPEEMNVPGFDFHALKGFDPVRYTVHVNGPWCITFEFQDADAQRVDFEQYH